MNRLHEQQLSEMNLANCFHFDRFLWCQKERPEKSQQNFKVQLCDSAHGTHTPLFGMVLHSIPQYPAVSFTCVDDEDLMQFQG